jgi:hypothetical protein
MEQMKVGDLMVPISDYVCIPENASLGDAILALEQARERCCPGSYSYKAVLVCTKEGKVLGKLSLLDIVRSLEPRYMEFGDLKKYSGYGLSAWYLKATMAEYGIWQTPLDDLCRKAEDVTVRTIVAAPLEGEIVDEYTPLDRALHQLIVGHFQSLLVRSGGEFVGLFRLADVFDEVARRIKVCHEG